MKTTTIRQSVQFKAAPAQVFELLMNQKMYSAFAGNDVRISPKVGGKFSVFDGYCTGINLEIEPQKKIVQSWHFAEDGWPDDHFSTCTFEFMPNESGTKLNFVQTDVPEFCNKALSDGWKKYYWEPMKTYLKLNS